MKTISRVAAASLIAATILAPLGALARDCDEDHEDRDERARYYEPPRYDVQPGWVQPAPAPATWRDDGLVWDGRGWVRQGYDPRYDQRYDPRNDQQRFARAAEVRDLRFQLRRLDDDRAAFVARWGWHPRKVARYDAWYLPRRAELQDRLDRLTAYAWR